VSRFFALGSNPTFLYSVISEMNTTPFSQNLYIQFFSSSSSKFLTLNLALHSSNTSPPHYFISWNRRHSYSRRTCMSIWVC